jgi:hypothetical protein
VYHHQKERVMHKSLPPLPPPQAPLPCSNHSVGPQLPIDKRQQCHERMAQRLIHGRHSAPSAEGNHAPQDALAPSPT